MAALVAGRTALNPDAPPFIPAAVRQIEDFSPEWWELVTTSSSFQEYWMRERADDALGDEEYDFDGDCVVGLLPETLDLSADGDLSLFDGPFEVFIPCSESGQGDYGGQKIPVTGSKMDSAAPLKKLAVLKSPKGWGWRAALEAAKCREKLGQYVRSKCGPRIIQQPR